MTWQRVVVGGVDLRETWTAEQDGANVGIAGQESTPPSTPTYVEAVHANVTAFLDEPVVPVVFGDKDTLTGFYRVRGGSSKLSDFDNGGIITADWSLQLERVGGERDVEVESVVPSTPTMARATVVSGMPTAVFWHAPAVGTTSYLTGPTVPAATFTRASADGAVPVHLGIPAGVAPRWAVSAVNYLAGSARLVVGGIRRVGLRVAVPATGWSVDNGLVRLRPDGAGFDVSCWVGGAWRSVKGYVPAVSGTNIPDVPEVTVLRNDPEEVIIRLTYPSSPGRVTVDLGVRRGARVVTGVVKRHSAAALSLRRTAAEAASAVTGGLRATAADGDGHRYVMGSVATITTTTSPVGITKASSTSLDFFVGHEVAGAVAGDAYTDLLAQYRGHTGERARVVLR